MLLASILISVSMMAQQRNKPEIKALIRDVEQGDANSHSFISSPNNPTLDVSFEKDGTYIDDIQVGEIQTGQKNSRAIAIESIGELPLNIAFLIDTSGSQRTKIDAILQFYTKLLELIPLRQIDSACLISFSDDILIRQAPTSDKTLLLKGIDNIIPSGGTTLLDAIYAMCRIFGKYGDSRKVIFVITDGQDRDSAVGIQDAFKAAIETNVRIYIFLTKSSPFNRPQHYVDLYKYTAKTGGNISTFSDLKSGETAFSKIIDELRHLKRITFSSEDSKKSKSCCAITISRKGVKPKYALKK
jgi:Mg-chelatase subunit ChlD